MGANKSDYFTKMRCYGLMLPESLKSKKVKNVCGVFWLPCLPCENAVK
jgi:hypothetical protein